LTVAQHDAKKKRRSTQGTAAAVRGWKPGNLQ